MNTKTLNSFEAFLAKRKHRGGTSTVLCRGGQFHGKAWPYRGELVEHETWFQRPAGGHREVYLYTAGVFQYLFCCNSEPADIVRKMQKYLAEEREYRLKN